MSFRETPHLIVQKTRRGSLNLACASALASILVCSAYAQAQTAAATDSAPAQTDAATGANGDIIVTATRQSQTAQSVPLSLTAVGADQLAKEGVTSASQLGQIAPSLYVLSSVSEGSPRVTIRGLTGTDYLPAGSPTIATYVDDVYQAFQFGITSALFDLQRVEILRGPQGTTFGRNTTGGAVAYFSQTPTNKAEGYVSGRLAGGDQSQRFIEGAVNVPIVDDVLAMRISGRVDSKGNWIRDLANDRGRGAGDGQAGRFQLRWTPSSDTTVNLTAFSTRWRGDAPISRGEISPVAAAGLGVSPISPDPHSVSLNSYNLYDNFDNRGTTLRVEQALGLFNLTSITHYRWSRYATKQDNDGIAEDIFLYKNTSKAEQYGQEVRLASDPTLRVSGILGAYYEHDRVNEVGNEASLVGSVPFFTPIFNNIARYRTKTETYAAFGNLTFKLTDSLSVIGGLRKTIEKRNTDATKSYFGGTGWTEGNMTFTGTPQAGAVLLAPPLDYQRRVKSKPWTWDATINYNPAKSLLVFARVAKGYRSGGFNPAPTSAPTTPDELAVLNPFKGESVQSYEAGIKSTWFDRVLRINASVYHYDFSNQQVTEFLPVAGLPVAFTTNAGKSKVDGGEVEIFVTPDDHWQLRGSVAYTDARYDRYISLAGDFSGNRLVQSPRWSGNASIGYATPVSETYNVRATTSWSYRTKIYFDSANSSDFTDKAVAKGTIRLGLEPSEGKGFSITAFVDNVTDQTRLASGFAFFPGYNAKYFEPGRSYGIDVSYRW